MLCPLKLTVLYLSKTERQREVEGLLTQILLEGDVKSAEKDAATSQGMPMTTKSWKRQGTDSP